MMDEVFVSVGEAVMLHGRFRPDDIALECTDLRLSWSQFETRVSTLAAYLHARGVGRGDHVVLLTGMSAVGVIAKFAIWRIGAVAVPIATTIGPDVIRMLLEDAAPAVMVVDRSNEELGKTVVEDGEIAVVVASSANGSQPCTVGDFASADQFASIFYSSGTTGTPKGIVHSSRARLMTAVGLAGELGIGPDSVVAIATPLYTNGTWMMLLPLMLAGGRAIILDHWSTDGFLDALEAGATHAFLVPTQIRAVLDALAQRPVDTSGVRAIVSSGSPIPSQWKAEAQIAFYGRLFELYGLTEGVATILRPEHAAHHHTSVGRPMAGVELRIVDDAGRAVDAGTIGEIVGRGAGLMTGYLNNPEATESATWRSPEGTIYLRTGDVGRIDHDGFLTLLDRKKDMIVSGGMNVFAADIETVLHRHPAVKVAAVIGMPHPKWVETPVAVVTCCGPVTSEELLAWVNPQLARHQRIDRVILREQDFPRNALGKILKRVLREEMGR